MTNGFARFAYGLRLWAALQLRPQVQSQADTSPLPARSMLPEMAGNAGLGYIVHLTFLSAWMPGQGLSLWSGSFLASLSVLHQWFCASF